MRRNNKWISIVLSLCMIVALLPVMAPPANAASASAKYSDVIQTEWYVPYVDYVVEHGLMAGTSNTSFAPNSGVTRAQYVQVLYALAEKPAGAKSAGFTDVESGKWYTDAVNWAAAVGVTGGMTKTTFAPNIAVTREQAATFFKAYAKKVAEATLTESAEISSFPDQAQVSNYAVTPMKWAVGAGLISGMKSGSTVTLAPKGTLTRAQLATMLKAFDEYLGGKSNKNIDKDYPYVKDGTFTRGEWIAVLIKKLGIKLPEDLTDMDFQFSDTGDSEYGTEIEVAYGLGFLPESEVEYADDDVPEFHPNDPATREYAAYTAARAMGFDGTHNFADVQWTDLDAVSYKDEAQIAVHFNFLTAANNKFDPKKTLEKAEVLSIFRGMDALDESTEIDESDVHDDSVLADGVISDTISKIDNYTATRNADGTYTVTLPDSAEAEKLKNRDVIVLPENDEHPNGVALKISEVQTGNGKVVLQGKSPEIEEVYETIDVAGVGVADVNNVTTAPGVTYSYDPDGEIEEEDSGTLQLQRAVDAYAQGSTGTLEFDLGKLNLGEKGSVTGKVGVSIPLVYARVKGNVNNPLNKGPMVEFEEFLFKMEGKIQINGTVNYKAAETGYLLKGEDGKTRAVEQHQEIGRIPIPIPETPISVDVIFYVTVSVKGSISITYTMMPMVGYQYKNGTGRFLHDFKQHFEPIELKATAKAGIGMEIAVAVAEIMDLAGVEADAGPAMDLKFEIRKLQNNKLRYCGDGTIYVYFDVGLSKATALGKYLDKIGKLPKKLEILKNNSKNPHKKKFHVEDGKLVDSCTYGIGKMKGLVRGENDKPISGARICIYSESTSDQPIRTVYSDNKGEFHINDLSVGNYDVVVMAKNYLKKCLYSQKADSSDAYKWMYITLTATSEYSDYIKISSAEDLNAVRNNLSRKYVLINNIDLSTIGGWVPIGSEEKRFTGILDGNGYSITNMNVSVKDKDYAYAGLFGYTDRAEIKNISNITGTIKCENAAPVLAAGGIAGAISQTTISNCNTNVDITYKYGGDLTGEPWPSTKISSSNLLAGGIVGDVASAQASNGGSASSTISHCSACGNIKATGSEAYSIAGGIVGFAGMVESLSTLVEWENYKDPDKNDLQSLSINDCYSGCFLSVKTDYPGVEFGGIVGAVLNEYLKSCSITNCCNNTSFNAQSGKIDSAAITYMNIIGGIIGILDEVPNISNCSYSTNHVTKAIGGQMSEGQLSEQPISVDATGLSESAIITKARGMGFTPKDNTSGGGSR